MTDASGVIDETAEMEAAKERKALTAEQKQAATIRRKITMLSEFPGNEAHIAKLQAEADALAPVEVRTGRVDPLKQLSEHEQKVLRTEYFRCTKEGFAQIAALVSYKKLAEIVTGL